MAVLTACDKAPDGSLRFPGQPKIENKWVAPTEITDFIKIYNRNCIGCHSNGPETVSASIPMDNEIYLSIVPKEALRNVIANGVPGTLMPGFSIKAGDELTDKQVEILVKGILAKKPPVAAVDLPAYNAPTGDAINGKALFDASAYAKVTDSNRSILNPAFLGTISDQYLRTLLIIGLPKLGYPDFRTLIPGKTLTTGEISDLVAWIASNRKNEYGHPLEPVMPTNAPTSPNSIPDASPIPLLPR